MTKKQETKNDAAKLTTAQLNALINRMRPELNEKWVEHMKAKHKAREVDVVFTEG